MKRAKQAEQSNSKQTLPVQAMSSPELLYPAWPMQPSTIRPAHQAEHTLLLDLGHVTAPVQHYQIQSCCSRNPSALQTWREHQCTPAMYGVRLVGDTRQPDAFVGMATQDLVSCSQWGAARFRQSGMQDCGLHAVVPVRTSHAVVLKLVKGLYSGHIELTDDVEELLLLANSMQVFARPLTVSGLLYVKKLPGHKQICVHWLQTDMLVPNAPCVADICFVSKHEHAVPLQRCCRW